MEEAENMTVLEQKSMEASIYNLNRIADALESTTKSLESIAKSLERLAGAVQTNINGDKDNTGEELTYGED